MDEKYFGAQIVPGLVSERADAEGNPHPSAHHRRLPQKPRCARHHLVGLSAIPARADESHSFSMVFIKNLLLPAKAHRGPPFCTSALPPRLADLGQSPFPLIC